MDQLYFSLPDRLQYTSATSHSELQMTSTQAMASTNFETQHNNGFGNNLTCHTAFVSNPIDWDTVTVDYMKPLTTEDFAFIDNIAAWHNI